MARGTAGISIQVTGVKRLDRALRALGEKNPPFIAAAFAELGPYAASEVARRAPGSMGSKMALVSVRRPQNLGRTKILIEVNHPGAKTMEFGRKYYWTGYTGRRMKATGTRVTRPGSPPRPFVGIKEANLAVGAIAARMREVLATAIENEWSRLAEG